MDDSTNKTLKTEFVYQERFDSLRDPQIKMCDYAWWHDNERLHSELGCMSPVEFRRAGLNL